MHRWLPAVVRLVGGGVARRTVALAADQGAGQRFPAFRVGDPALQRALDGRGGPDRGGEGLRAVREQGIELHEGAAGGAGRHRMAGVVHGRQVCQQVGRDDAAVRVRVHGPPRLVPT
jgi:hypothetical protein